MITHLSFSSLALFLHNPSAWHRKYVLNQREASTSPAALVGTAFHSYVEHVLKGQSPENSLLIARQALLANTEVDWGKTGSSEKSAAELDKFIEAWTADFKLNGEVIAVEQNFTAKLRGIKIPLLGYTDCVLRRAGGLVIVDWKSIRSFETEPKPAHIIQAFMYKWLVEATLREPVIRAEIVQVKASKNEDGSPRVRVLPIDFVEREKEGLAVKKLIQQALKMMTRKTQIFLPNIRDEYEGETEWKRYAS